MQGKEEDEGILSYVEDDDAAMCVSAHRTLAVIFLECYKHNLKIYLFIVPSLSLNIKSSLNV